MQFKTKHLMLGVTALALSQLSFAQGTTVPSTQAKPQVKVSANAATPVTPTTRTVTIGILEPMAIPAMTQIINGFKDTLNASHQYKFRYLVKNAQNNLNIQRSILQEFKTDGVDIVAPIGQDASQMTISMIRNKPIVGLASIDLKKYAHQSNNLDVTGDLDQIKISKQINFIHRAMPKLKKLTLIYSAQDRMMTQVKQVEVAAKKDHIKVQKLMMTQLSELYSVGHSIAHNSQAIFILKDEMIVSGVNTLLNVARKRHIPLIASDDGSVGKGAAFALGVSERQIGVDAAKEVLKILAAKPVAGKVGADGISLTKAAHMPVHIITHYHVFINPKTAPSQGVNPKVIEKAAKASGYPVQKLG